MINKEYYEDFETGFTFEIFNLFAKFIYDVSGIKLTLHKRYLLFSRLLKRLRHHNMHNFYEYYRMVRNDSTELIEMLNSIATNTTYFFREKHHFDFLKNVCIPDIVSKKHRGELIIWSAGCSTGEEPYSIAITAHEGMNMIHEGEGKGSFSIRIIGTDISTRALEFAKRGVYEIDQIPEEIPSGILCRYFDKCRGEDGGKIMVKDFIRNMVTFKRLNLKDDEYTMEKNIDIIFCRNVMIYFSEEMKKHVLSMFYKHLRQGGYLFLGHAEALLNRKEFQPVFISVYKKMDEKNQASYISI